MGNCRKSEQINPNDVARSAAGQDPFGTDRGRRARHMPPKLLEARECLTLPEATLMAMIATIVLDGRG
jgi:hypothetical protein